jgi:hypothetical protein
MGPWTTPAFKMHGEQRVQNSVERAAGKGMSTSFILAEWSDKAYQNIDWEVK